MDIRSIDVKVSPRHQVFTLVQGIYPKGGFIAGYQVDQHTSTQDPAVEVIDLHLQVRIEPQDPNKVHTTVMASFKREFDLGVLNPGRYVLRINGNNKWVRWFNVGY